MSKQTDAAMLREMVVFHSIGETGAEVLQRVAAQLESDAKRYAETEKLQDIGKNAFECIAEMVAALECDYDRLEELREQRDGSPIEWTLEAWEAEREELAELEKAAGECTDRESAEQRIQEDPLSLEVRSDWYSPGSEDRSPAEFNILLGTGGPATRIIGELDESGEVTRARLQTQDWFTPWTDYVASGTGETLLAYCRCFYFGEG